MPDSPDTMADPHLEELTTTAKLGNTDLIITNVYIPPRKLLHRRIQSISGSSDDDDGHRYTGRLQCSSVVVVVDLPLLRVAVEGSDNPVSLEKPCQVSLPPDQQGATLSGDNRRSSILLEVYKCVQLKRWSMVCGCVLHRGQRGEGWCVSSTLCRYDIRMGLLLVRSWAMVRRVSLGRESSEGEILGAC